jgi:uncharacterized membrane protein
MPMVVKTLMQRFHLTTNHLLWGAVVVLAMIAFGSMFFNPAAPAKVNEEIQSDVISETLEGRVVQVLSQDQTTVGEQEQPSQRVLVEITKGGQEGRMVEIEYGGMTVTTDSRRVRAGDRVLIEYSRGPTGEHFYISDFIRLSALLLLALLFAVATVIVGRRVGLRSLISMGFSILIIALFILPRLSDGQNPVLICIVGSFLAMAPSLYLTYGWNWKTHSALLGLAISLMVTSLLAALFVGWGHLTGFGSEEAAFLVLSSQTQIDLRGLALGGIIIGTLGVLDDVTIGQASATFELKRANPGLNWQQLFRHGMVIGRDHIASMVNTLMMAYVGAALPLFLLLMSSSASLAHTLNREFLAEEIIRTLVGSLGLILAVPITSLIAGLVAERRGTSDMAESTL